MHIDLKELKAVTNQILLFAREAGVQGAINWGDLRCVSALKVVDEYGEVTYRVEIEEVAPDAHELQHWVSNKLEEAGFEGVMVYTEW